VGLVEIDHVRLEAPQARLDGALDVKAREARVVRARAHATAALGGEEDAVALPPRLEPAPDDLLGASDALGPPCERVDVRRVEEVDAPLEGAIEDREGRGLVALMAEGHGTEAERGHPQARASEGS
jgi:hypothetical protein